jgi:hypothetical protein
LKNASGRTLTYGCHTQNDVDTAPIQKYAID